MLQPAMESKLMLSHPAKESKLILSPVANPTMLLQPAKESRLMLSPVTNPTMLQPTEESNQFFATVDNTVMCIYCDKKFDAIKYLRAHMRRVHRIVRKLLCQRCRNIHKFFFSGHTAGMIMEEIPRFIIDEDRAHCSVCDKLYGVLRHV